MKVKVLGFKHLVFSPKEKPEEKVDCTTCYVAMNEITRNGKGYDIEKVNVHSSKMPFDEFMIHGLGDYDFSYSNTGKLVGVSYIGEEPFKK